MLHFIGRMQSASTARLLQRAEEYKPRKYVFLVVEKQCNHYFNEICLDLDGLRMFRCKQNFSDFGL
jgi:hypothetical protein